MPDPKGHLLVFQIHRKTCRLIALSSSSSLFFGHIIFGLEKKRFGDEERRLMHLVPAPAVKLMKGRVLSRPGMKKCLGLSNG
jgi:hypothetical protein